VGVDFVHVLNIDGESVGFFFSGINFSVFGFEGIEGNDMIVGLVGVESHESSGHSKGGNDEEEFGIHL